MSNSKAKSFSLQVVKTFLKMFNHIEVIKLWKAEVQVFATILKSSHYSGGRRYQGSVVLIDIAHYIKKANICFKLMVSFSLDYQRPDRLEPEGISCRLNLIWDG